MNESFDIETKKVSLFTGIFPHIYLQQIFIILFFGCTSPCQKKQNEVNEKLYTIDVESIIDKNKDITLSEVSTNISYIPLETRQDNLLSNIIQIEMTESFIFVCDKNKLLQFTKEGKFLRQIGNTGHGPGEYTSIMNFAVNEKSNIIMIDGEYQFNIYDIKGNFKRKLTNPFGSLFVFYNPTRIAFYLSNNINQPVNLVITDLNLMPLQKFQNHDPRAITSLKFGRTPLYTYENELYFKENFNDTVFCLKDTVLLAHIIFKERKLLLDKDFDLRSTGQISNLLDQLDKVKDKLMSYNIFESRRFVFSSYKKGLDPRNVKYIRVLFDKEKGDTNITDSDGLTNDIDGGINMWPLKIYQDSLMVNYLTAFDFKNYIYSKSFKNSIPKYPEKKKELEKLANSLNENDNPVLILIKLKD